MAGADTADTADPEGSTDLPEHVAANRAAWDGFAHDYVAAGEREWARMPGEET